MHKMRHYILGGKTVLQKYQCLRREETHELSEVDISSDAGSAGQGAPYAGSA